MISKVTSSHTSTLILSVFKVTRGMSGCLEFGGKTMIGPLPRRSSLDWFPSSLSNIFTPNINSPGCLGTEKKV